MRRSAQVAAPLLAAAALASLTGCRPQMQRCVDENNNVVADNFCADQKNQPGQRRPDGHGGFIFLPMYRFYYGGAGSYAFGSSATGGSFSPSSGASYATGTSRGGFGSSFSSSGHTSSSGE